MAIKIKKQIIDEYIDAVISEEVDFLSIDDYIYKMRADMIEQYIDQIMKTWSMHSEHVWDEAIMPEMLYYDEIGLRSLTQKEYAALVAVPSMQELLVYNKRG